LGECATPGGNVMKQQWSVRIKMQQALLDCQSHNTGSYFWKDTVCRLYFFVATCLYLLNFWML